MSLENWHVLTLQAKQRHEKHLNSINQQQPQLARKLLLISAAVVLLITTAYPIGIYGTTSSQSTISAAIHRVSPGASSPTATVYVAPQTVAQQGLGSTFTVQVKVANMDQFNGWDIQIVTADVPQVLNVTSLSISGNIFAINTTGGSPFEIVHCIDGVGTGCTSTDGPGIAHSAFGDTAFTSGNGLLFTITYRVIGNGPYASLTYGNSLISSSSPSGVPHFSQNGTYGTATSAGSGSKSLVT